MRDARERLMLATQAVQTAVTLIRMEQATIDAALKEFRDMDSFGCIIDPTLFNDSERRAARAVVEPLFESALTFLRAHDYQIAKAKEALAKVNAHPVYATREAE